MKGARVRSVDLRSHGVANLETLAVVLDAYDGLCRDAGLVDPQDRRWIAATRLIEGGIPWLRRFDRAVLHALYDLNEAEFTVLRNLIEALPEGGTVMLFNTTANVKPTQFAEWTWQRFVYDESLSDKTFPEFCRPLDVNRAVLDRLFIFDSANAAADAQPLPADPSLRIVQAPGRYKEIEWIASEIADLLSSGERLDEIAVVVRHIESYGEMIEDVFVRYNIPHTFETGVPLVRVPFIKYWLSLLDLVTSDRSRDAFARIMGSAYYEPRLSPATDIERELASFGYIDRHHLSASALASRKSSPLSSEILRLESWLDTLEGAVDSALGFLEILRPRLQLDGRDSQAWERLSDDLRDIDSILGVVPFEQFRRIASEFVGIRTVERSSGFKTNRLPGLPGVRVVAPGSLGYRGYRWIFAPGFSDGEFPARSSSNPLLKEDSIVLLNRKIRPRRLLTARDRNRREPLFLFMILDSASQRVSLTFPATKLEGETIYPSIYISEISRHYDVEPVERLDRDLTVRETREWLRKVADEWRKGTLDDAEATDLLGADISRRAALEATGIYRGNVQPGLISIEGAWHPSELNALQNCPFVFLAKHRLKLRSQDMPDFEVPSYEVGILAHASLRDFHSLPVPGSVEEARKRMEAIIAQRLASVDINGQGAYSVFEPALWQIRRRQLVAALLKYLDFAVRDAIQGYETLSEYLDKPLPQARLGGILLGGKPDHIAVLRNGSNIAGIRIDDFKYSAASSSTTKQLKESLQIPVYGYLAGRAMNAEDDVRFEGRYLLLRSPSNPVVSLPIDSDAFREVQLQIENLVSTVSKGRVHPAPADRQTCERCEYRRLCRIQGA
jgi:hypothetical protein